MGYNERKRESFKRVFFPFKFIIPKSGVSKSRARPIFNVYVAHLGFRILFETPLFENKLDKKTGIKIF